MRIGISQMKSPFLTFSLLFFSCICAVAQDSSRDLPQVPRIESVVIINPQPHESARSTIWYDDFDDDSKQDEYPEKHGEATMEQYFGAAGKSLRMYYPKGKHGIGNRKVFFGDSPTHLAKTIRRKETFTDIYWRIYVKHPRDWTGGGPAKLSRATSLVPPGWRQAMIAHVWSSGEELTLDPASGVRNGRVVTTRYNDFENLRWLGNKPTSRFKLHGSEGSGWWVCVEARAKLNTPGKKDGVNQLWIDGRLEAERQALDWRGSYTERGINAVFLEAYWNQGSPIDQSRWIDNFVISTEPIGPVVCPGNPILIKTPYEGPGAPRLWRVEVADDAAEPRVVWRSHDLQHVRRVTVGTTDGRFVDSLKGQKCLEAGHIYCVHVRQQTDTGEWPAWSAWHQRFCIERQAN